MYSILENARDELYHLKDGNIYAIYGHKNKLTDEWYIGQTKFYKNPEKRWGSEGQNYLRKKTNGKYQNPKFADAILKYGWSNFEHIVLKFGLEEDIDILEQEFITKYNSILNGYNLSSGGQRNGKILSDESRLKMSYAAKGKRCGENNPMYGIPPKNKGKITPKHIRDKISDSLKGKSRPNLRDENSKSSIPVVAYDIKTLKPLKKFASAKSAGIFFNGLNGSHITSCIKGSRKHAYGYIWKLFNGSEIIDTITNEEFLKYRVFENKKSCREISIIDITNNTTLKFESIKDMLSYINISEEKFYNLIETTDIINGYKIMYRKKKYKNKHNDLDLIKLVDINGKTLLFDNKFKASEALGIPISDIQRCLRGERKSCHGYKCELIEK